VSDFPNLFEKNPNVTNLEASPRRQCKSSEMQNKSDLSSFPGCRLFSKRGLKITIMCVISFADYLNIQLVNECKYALLQRLTTVNDVAVLLNISKKALLILSCL